MSAPASFQPSRVVLVDVKVDRRAVMRSILELALGDGTVVAQVATSSEAVAAVDNQHANTAVVEIQLPLATGFDVIAALRAAHPQLFIVVCTFEGNQAARQGALDAGSDRFLLKPVGAKELRTALSLERVLPLAEAVAP